MTVNLGFLDRSRCFLFQVAEWAPFQTHYFSGNLVVPRIELGTPGSVVRNSDHQTTEALLIQRHEYK
jgi:hypothetical protein